MSHTASKRIASRWFLALLLTIGVAGTWMTVAIWFLNIAFNQAGGQYQSVVFDPDGKAYVQTYDPRSGQSRSYRGLDGTEHRFNDQAWLTQAVIHGDTDLGWLDPPRGWAERITPMSDGAIPANYWYFMHDGEEHGAAYFVGYDARTRRKLGYLDAAGFHADSPTKPFNVPLRGEHRYTSPIASTQYLYSGDTVAEPHYYQQIGSGVFPSWRAYLIDGDRIVEVDLRKRDQPPREVLTYSGLRSVAIHHGFSQANGNWALALAAAAPPPKDDQPKQADVLVATTETEIIVYDPTAVETVLIERPAELAGKTLSFYRPVEGGYLLQYQRQSTEGTMLNEVYRFDATGSFLARDEVALTYGQPSDTSTISLGMIFAAPVPAIATVAMFALPMTYTSADPSLSYAEALGMTLADFWIYPSVMLAVSCLLSVACYRRQRRYADRVIVPWIVLIMLTGVPGYVGYRLHRHWPARVRCPSCNEPSPRDRDSCVDCEAQWPEPERTGAEVFA